MREPTRQNVQPSAGRRRIAAAAAVLAVLAAAATADDWPACRGSYSRTGNLDGQAGPDSPSVLWVYKAQEHYLASPVPGPENKSVYIGGLGAFNTGVFHRIAVQRDVPERVLWTKAAPFLKRPTVSSPALVDGLVVFGDGMHQTDDAILYCLDAKTGRCIWQLPIPGKLVHMEGAPAVRDGRVYIGGGDAGVLCVSLKEITLDGKDIALDAAKALLDKRWAELKAKYEQDKKADPEFAVPPSEDSLPKPAPKLLWQQGVRQWHVDAPMAARSKHVYAASAFLDIEKVGKRCLLCLDGKDGKTVWEAPLKYNPWAGATITRRELVLVGCSSIRFDLAKIKDAKGEVVALNAANGQVKWRKEVPGGILSPVAASRRYLAVFAATDGKVRALDAASGKDRWTYDCGSPLFSGPALAGNLAYVADLKGVLHAIDLSTGRKVWTLDVAADPSVQAPGGFYASPLVLGGRIYLATCNIAASGSDKPSAVVCIADKTAATPRSSPVISVDKAARTVSVPCKVALRKLPTLKDIYPLEVVATFPSPRGQKAHETVVTFEARPSDVHNALVSLGLKPGKPAKGQGAAVGPEVEIRLQFADAGGAGVRSFPVESALVDRRTGKAMGQVRWRFTGSSRRQPDPAKPEKVYGADLSGTLIAIFPVTDETVFQSSLTMEEEGLLKLETNAGLLPRIGTAGSVIIRVRDKPAGLSARSAAVVFGEALPPAHRRELLAPLAAAPQPYGPLPLYPMSGPSWLPPAGSADAPRVLPRKPRESAQAAGASDLPPLASIRYQPTARRPLPAQPLPRGARPGGIRFVFPPATRSVDPGRLAPAADPTDKTSRRAVLADLQVFREAPAPFLLLAIPDPFQAITAVQLAKPLPDDDPPALSWDVPSRPTLPELAAATQPTKQVAKP